MDGDAGVDMKLTHGRLEWGIDGPLNVTRQPVNTMSQFSI